MERGEDGKYELPEDYRYYLFILQKKKTERDPKNYSLAAVTQKIKKSIIA